MRAKLIYGIPDKDADLFYVTRFQMSDPAACLIWKGRTYFFIGGFEYPRACKQAKVDKVVNSDTYREKAQKLFKNSSIENQIHLLLKDFQIKDVEMPRESSFYLVDALRKKGYRIHEGGRPFILDRTVKNEQEKNEVVKVQKLTFSAIGIAEQMLSLSKINGQNLFLKGKKLTSEMIRHEIERFLFENGLIASATIVAGGRQGIDPHDIGHGQLRPHEPIIVDVFPQSVRTHFCGDATRTFCKGKPSKDLKRMYKAVKDAQELALSEIKDGVNGRVVHQAVCSYFEKSGFSLKILPNRRDGFIHGTGHGVGMEIHEEPVRIGVVDYVLKKGNITSVEPGLYYTGIGGVRIEDLVFVTKNGCEILGKYKKELVVE